MADYKVLDVKTNKREEFIDITAKVRNCALEMGLKDGAFIVFVPHTTAGLLINENADPSVMTDILGYLNENVPRNKGYLHGEGNSDAHIKATLVGNSQLLLINEGEIVLGTWQGIFLGEFDGPRNRKVWVGQI